MSAVTPVMPPEAAAALLLNQVATGYMLSAALQAALKLEIADRLTAGPRSIADLARDAGVSDDGLYRVLRALASVGITTNKDGSLSLNKTRFQTALASAPTAVTQLFAGSKGVAATLESRINSELNSGGAIDSRSKTLIKQENALTDQTIKRYLDPMIAGGIDTLVLGCTHYPLLAGAIGRVLGEGIKLVDSARNCAVAVKELLDRQSLRAPISEKGSLKVALTDSADNFLDVAKEALQLEISDLEVRSVL